MSLFWKSKPKDPKKQFEDLLKNIRKNGLDAEIKELMVLAESGYPEAEFLMADVHESILKIPGIALNYYKSAAEHGHAQAQWRVANLYMMGKEGVKRDKQRAAYWYHKAAENNIAEAQFVLGELYRSGEPGAEISKDSKQSFEWYKKSLGNGYKPAAMRIEQFFPEGVLKETIPSSDDVPSASTETLEITESLRLEIIAAMRREGFIPQEELPHIPELAPYSERLVAFVCSSVNEAMKTRGLDDDEMTKLFQFVFLRTVDVVYQWHKAENGVIDADMAVGDPLAEDEYLQLPADIVSDIRKMQAPQIVYALMREWWSKNSEDLRIRGVDIWVPLSASLLMMSLTGVSIALKIFGYRK